MYGLYSNLLVSFWLIEFGDETVSAHSSSLTAITTSSTTNPTLANDARTGEYRNRKSCISVLIVSLIFLSFFPAFLLGRWFAAVYGTPLSRWTKTRCPDASNGTWIRRSKCHRVLEWRRWINLFHFYLFCLGMNCYSLPVLVVWCPTVWIPRGKVT